MNKPFFFIFLGLAIAGFVGAGVIMFLPLASAPKPAVPLHVVPVKRSLQLTSSAFADTQSIPSKYTCEGQSLIPPLSISNVPAGAKSLVLFVEDPDTARGTFDHWVMFNIPPDTSSIAEGKAPSGVMGNNGTGKTGYIGPCPPTGNHHYRFKLSALDTMLDLKQGASKADVMQAMENHVVGNAELVGMFQKQK